MTRWTRRGAAVWSAAALALAAWPASAEGPGEEARGAEAPEPANSFPTHHIYYQGVVGLGWNPLSLGSLYQLGYRYMLYDDPGVLWKDSYVLVGLAPGLNPTSSRIGPLLEIKPLAVLRLTAMFERIDYFGNFDNIFSRPSPRDDHSDTLRAERGDAGEHYSTHATQLTLEGRLQAKVGPIAARATGRAVRAHIEIREGDTVYYDPFYDQILANDAWLFGLDADVLYVSDAEWVVGLRYALVAPNYPASAFRPGEPTDNPNTQQRLGPLFAWTFSKDPGSLFNEPSVFAMAHVWLQHRHRTGDDSPRAVPFLLVGFAFNGLVEL